MSIQMIGIDHSKADLDVRCIFSFTKKSMAEALEVFHDIPGILGCVMISTCNRMELWASLAEDGDVSLVEALCRQREVDVERYRPFFVEREGEEAVMHLFEVACGLKSKILGEDQIITQVKEALAFARQQYVVDNVLEILFRMAVTAAKKVKTQVSLTNANQSVIHHAINVLKKQGYGFEGKKCMVIGNGAMGKLAATALQTAGCDVTVTVRQYRSGVVDIPRNCSRINYGERMTLFPECDLVVSATSSPNYTLTREIVERVELQHPVLLLDLAVPRDIDPSMEQLFQITMYDIDDFQVEIQSEQLKCNIEKAKQILEEQRQEFEDWYECRDVIPKIQEIKRQVAEDMLWRLLGVVKSLPMEEREKETLKQQMSTAAEKAVNKMMFGLRGQVDNQTFRECIEGLEQIYGEE